MTALDQPTLEALGILPDRCILDLAVEFAREDTASQQLDPSEAALIAMFTAGATALGSDQLEDHQAVTAAVAGFARAMFRDVLAESAP